MPSIGREGSDCPVCKIMDELKDANNGLDSDLEEIEKLKECIAELEEGNDEN